MANQQIILTGGSPWGFKMTGGRDFRQPLAIGKVKPNGKAFVSGVIEGHIIEKVNGEEFENLTHHEAQNKIKSAGFTLTLTLRKPKLREPEPQTTTIAAPPVTTYTPPPPVTKSSPAPLSFKASGTHFQRFNSGGKYQNGGLKSESKTAPSKAPATKQAAPINGEKPTVSPEIQQLIEEEEKALSNPSPPVKTGSIKTWQPETNNASNHSVSPPPISNQNKSKAASNIGKFITQGTTTASTYGEPTFAKPLLDVTKPMGEPAVIEIRLGPNLPVPSVHWYHNNKPVRESKEKDITFLSRGPVHTVVFGELSTELLGTYTCTIMNKNGSKSCRCTLSMEKSFSQSRSPTSYAPPSGSLSPGSESKRVLASTSVGLYSNQNVHETYRGQLNRKSSRDSNEESEVLKALREDAPQKSHYKTPSMKFLEESLLPESDDL